jgi:hypothetical protein
VSRTIIPTATASPIPGTAEYRQKLIMPAREDGSRIRIGLYGPVHWNGGTRYWTELAAEHPDGTTRRAYTRQYSHRNLENVNSDYETMYRDLRDGRLTLPADLAPGL